MDRVIKRKDKGFTLVELVVVIVILAILIGVSVAGYSKYIGQSKVNTDVQNAEVIKAAIVNAQAEDGVYEELKGYAAGKNLVVTVNNTNLTITADTIVIDGTKPFYKAIYSQLQLDANPSTKIKTQTKDCSFTVTATIPETPDGSVQVVVAGTGSGYTGSALAPAA